MFRSLKASGHLKSEDDEPVFPAAYEYLFRIFFDLHHARPQTGFGMTPITYHDIDTYSRLMGIGVSPWDVRMVRQMDDVICKASRIQQEQKSKAAQGGGKK